MEITQEEIANMSPEQIAELQKQNCIFCHIISGKVSSKKVYEDDKCVAILDINPANPGHILLLPKEHFAIMPLVPEDIIAHMFTVAKHISQAQLKTLKAQGTTITAANGQIAGQRAPHFMIHIIPRKEADGVGFNYPMHPLSPDDESKLYSAIKKKANSMFGKTDDEPIQMDSRPIKLKSPTVEADFSEDDAAAENDKAAQDNESTEDDESSEDDVETGDLSDELSEGSFKPEHTDSDADEDLDGGATTDDEGDEDDEEDNKRTKASAGKPKPSTEPIKKPVSKSFSKPLSKTARKPVKSESGKSVKKGSANKEKTTKNTQINEPDNNNQRKPDLDLISRLF